MKGQPKTLARLYYSDLLLLFKKLRRNATVCQPSGVCFFRADPIGCRDASHIARVFRSELNCLLYLLSNDF